MSKVAARLKAVKTQVQAQIGGRHTCIIPAGKATGGPPLGTELGKLGVNIPSFVKDFNEKTKHMREGLPISCEIDVNPDRSYTLNLFSPPYSYFLFQAAGITCGAWPKYKETAGILTVKHCYEIAKIKQTDFYLSHKSLQEVTEIVIEKARSMGLKVQREPLDPKEYEKFLQERKAVLEQRQEEYRQQQEARLLRLS